MGFSYKHGMWINYSNQSANLLMFSERAPIFCMSYIIKSNFTVCPFLVIIPIFCLMF